MLIESLCIGSAAIYYYQSHKKPTKKIMQKFYHLKKNIQKNLNRITCLNAEENKQENNKANQRIKLSIIATGITSLSLIYPILTPISFISLSYLCIPIIYSASKKLKHNKKIGHDFLVSILAIIGLFSFQLLALAIALIFYYLGSALLLRTQNNAKVLLTKLFNEQVEYVTLSVNGIARQVKLEQIKVGDHIIVHTGDTIPIDGTIQTGVITVDQHQLTGEAQPIDREPADPVLASSQVLHGTATLTVEQTGVNTTAAKIGEILNRTADHKLALLSQGEQWADRIAIPLLGLSAIMLPVLGAAGASAILNCTFGNRLQLTAPLSVLNHLNLATHKGIMVKDGRALETLSKVDTILFDKTGTLTTQQPYVSAIITCSTDYSEERLLAEAAAAELNLSHPIAKAITAQAQDAGVILPEIDIEDIDFQIGLGIQVIIKNKTIRVGSQRFIEKQGISIPDNLQDILEEAYTKCHSIVFLASDKDLKGILEIAPRIRPAIQASLQKLRQQGIQHLAIVSGDQEKPTQQVAQKLGMDAYFAEVLPEDKANIINQLQKQGRTVCFIGDGINDAIAIKQADVSISIDGSSQIACDLAQIVFMHGDLNHLNDLFALALSLENNMHSTLTTLYIPTLINLFGAFFLGFGLMSTVIINNASLLLALKNTRKDSVKSFLEKT